MFQTARRDESDQASARVNRTVIQLWYRHFGEFSPVEAWSPPVNVYRLQNRVEVCVDLAGVKPESMEVRVEPTRLVIRGVRQAPEPPRQNEEPMRILAMEIDHGPFCRTIEIPENIELSRVTTDYSTGLLWVRLPLRDAG